MATAIQTVVGADPETRARIWVDLNRWRWPRDFDADAKPEWWDALARRDRVFGYTRPIMEYIEATTDDALIQSEWMKATQPPAEVASDG